MANTSAALNSLASTTIIDFYRPLAEKRGHFHSDTHLLKLSRYATVFWAIVLVALGMGASHFKETSAVELALSLASATIGLLLGIFLLGVLTKRVRQNAAFAGILGGLAIILFVVANKLVAWTWWVLIGTTATFAIGYAASYVTGEKE